MDEKDIEELEERLKKQKADRNYNFFKPVGQFIEHVDTINFSMDKDGNFHFENVGQVNGMTSKVPQTDVEAEYPQEEEKTQGACPPVQNCFKQMNDFIKEKVEAVVQKYYQGVAANLALIEITLFDHNLLKKRNAHTNLLRTLCAWGTIDQLSEEEMKKVMSGMANKMHALPSEGYLEWKGSDYVNDKKTCQDIGEDLGGTIKYFRKKEPKHV